MVGEGKGDDTTVVLDLISVCQHGRAVNKFFREGLLFYSYTFYLCCVCVISFRSFDG